MDAVEKAIRNALEKGDAGDRAFREKVYRSAFAALERSLQSKSDLAPEEAERRRDSLKHGITQIESEFVPAVAQPDDTEPQADAPRVPPENDIRRVEPSADELRAGGDENVHDAPARSDEWDDSREDLREDPREDPGDDDVSDEAIDAVQADERERWRPARQRRLGGSRIPVLALALLVLAVIAGAVWWAVSGAPTDRQQAAQKGGQESTVDDILREQSDGAAPADDAGGGEAATVPDEDWITVFSPADATAITTPPAADARIVQGDDERFVRIASPDASTALGFDIGQGALEALAGGGVVFSIMARAEEGGETQMSVSCDLGATGDCGRKRFVVGATRSEYLLEVDTSGSAPDAAGTISIVPDISGEGRALEIFEIRASRATR